MLAGSSTALTQVLPAQKTSIQAREGKAIAILVVFVQVHLGSRHS